MSDRCSQRSPLAILVLLMGLLLRFLAFVLNLALGAGLFLLTLLVMASRVHNINLAVVPLTGRTLTYTLFGASLYDFVAMVLALRKGRGTRVPMLLWNVVVVVLVGRGIFGGAGSFHGAEGFKTALWFFGVSLVGLVGAWLQWRAGNGGGRRR
jgi:hypothetical protein